VSHNCLKKPSGVQPPETVQKDYANEVTFPDSDGVNYDRPLKVTKAERFYKGLWGVLTHVL
jgi:hypothetical protein